MLLPKAKTKRKCHVPAPISLKQGFTSTKSCKKSSCIPSVRHHAATSSSLCRSSRYFKTAHPCHEDLGTQRVELGAMDQRVGILLEAQAPRRLSNAWAAGERNAAIVCVCACVCVCVCVCVCQFVPVSFQFPLDSCLRPPVNRGW